MPESHKDTSSTGAPVLTQLPDKGLEKETEDNLSVWAPATFLRDLEEGSGFCMVHAAYVAIWMILQVKDRFLSLWLSFCCSLCLCNSIK